MIDGKPDYRFKVVVIGAAGSGKTAMVERLVRKEFSEKQKTTVGVEFNPFKVCVNDFIVQLDLWDTAGQENYKAIAKSYFREAVGCVLVYDITSQKSFDELGFWLNQFRELADPQAFIILVGNKSDLESQRVISSDWATEFAEKQFLQYFETSALTAQNISEVFQTLCHTVFDRVRSGAIKSTLLTDESKKEKKSQSVNLDDQYSIMNNSAFCAC